MIEADTCVGCGEVVKASTIDLQKRKKKLCRSCCSFRKVFKEIGFMAVIRWKDDLAEARSYKLKGTVLLFKRASALRRVMDSEEFRADCRDRGETPEEVLDRECDDICCKFRVLMNVLKKYPTEHSWRTKSFQDMVLEVINENKQREDVSKPRTEWRQLYTDLKQQFDDLQERYDAQQRELAELKALQSSLATSVY